MLIQVVLLARDLAATTSVSTTIDLDTTDPRWPGRLVEAVTEKAREGARRLRDQIDGGESAPAPAGFVPLAEVVRGAEARPHS